jgi:osmotically-inducible protein OsmY
VANDIHVKLPGSSERDDTDIAQAVRHALQWDVLVPDERIRSTVSSGIVTLEGTVDTWSQYDDAVRCVRNLVGVVEVRAFLQAEPKEMSTSPSAIRSSIERALDRHAEHAAKHVQIAVAEGSVILSGEVSTWGERQMIEGAARGTPGVRRVDNLLRIHPA